MEKEIKKATEPFHFYTRLHLSELTGLKASNLPELLGLIKEAGDSAIYHHTHRFLLQHQYLSPEPPNDFAYWVTTALSEDRLGEKLASIDTMKYLTIHDLREKIVATIEAYLKNYPKSAKRLAPEDEVFYLIKCVSFIMPTPYVADDLIEFVEILKKITIDSIYFHMFEARLRLERKSNDFSLWIQDSIGDKDLAAKILKLDPYTYTLEDLRKTIIQMIEKKIG
ncbi:MAG: DUF5752 family protein [Candidatus Omnitrophota bacterium]